MTLSRDGPGAVSVERMAADDLERVLGSAELFERPLDEEAVARFLGRDDHHLLIAYLDGTAAGFALAHELPRLDGAKPKLLLYEIGTAPRARRRGVGRILIESMKQLGRRRGARSMFVITEESNAAAAGLYVATGAVRRAPDERVFEYPL